MKSNKIVTKQWLVDKITEQPVRTIGRALVAIFRNQTAEEQMGCSTILLNGRGFTKADGRIGALAAKYYLKNKKLEPWQLQHWLKPNAQGLPRIVKYANQLDAIARAKQTEPNMALLQTFNLTANAHT